MKEFIVRYFSDFQRKFASGIATEHTYRADIENLLRKIAPEVEPTNEARRIKCGAPDFVLTKKQIPLGYIEAKDILPGILDKKETQVQVKKYFDGGLGYNFILTDYNEFRFYRNNEIVEIVRLGELYGSTWEANENSFEKLVFLLKNFCSFQGQTMKSSKKLSEMMAGKARMIKNSIFAALNDEEDRGGDLRGQFETFKKVLIHDLNEEQFADVYAQTITYGLFAARLHDTTLADFSRYEAAERLKNPPFLRHFFAQIGAVNLDTRVSWIVDDLVELFRSCDVREILSVYGKSTRRNDPMVHFYEDFLSAYDSSLRKARGVWYTPEPVVDFIVRSLDEILQTEFGIADGLASSEKIEKDVMQQGKKVKKSFHKVQILDPATGTGTFLARVMKQVHSHFESMPAMWPAYAAKDLLPRLNGFEILMASYAMAHLKLELLLDELGGQTDKKERFHIFLTNSLEEPHSEEPNLFGMLRWLSEEAQEANEIKTNTPIMCVLGNPPYAVSSSNASMDEFGKRTWIGKLLEDYKKDLNEKKINLDDDYIKFLRYAEHFIEKNGSGVVAMITNNSFLDGVTHRQMRKHLLETFDKVFVYDLHGNAKKKETCPDGSKDENVFDIMQGVSISLFVKTTSSKKLGKIFHYDSFGRRKEKYEKLEDQGFVNTPWKELEVKEPYYFFVPKDFGAEKKYNRGFSISEIFSIFSSGIETQKDSVAIQFSQNEIETIQNDFQNLSQEELAKKYSLEDGRDWKIEWAKNDVQNENAKITDILYRPFDVRKTIYSGKTKGFMSYPRNEVMQHAANKQNICLIAKRGMPELNSAMCFLSKKIIDRRAWSCPGMQGAEQLFPLYLYPDSNQNSLLDSPTRTPNLNPEILAHIDEKLGMKFEVDFSPEDLFDYIYAVLHSPKYRETYKEFLKIDFPCVPFDVSAETFKKMVVLGTELRKLHLLESPLLSQNQPKYLGEGNNVVDKPILKNNQVWINDGQYFDSVPEIAWNFFIGGYQPAQKWLKDRKTRALDREDVMHYQKMVVALRETARVMVEIDEVFNILKGTEKQDTVDVNTEDDFNMPTIIDLDEIKKQIPGYSPEKADDFHELSAKIANKIFDTRLKEIKNQNIVLMCGGSASGKSEFLAKFLPEDFTGIVFDSTFSTTNGAEIKIKNILQSQNTPVICLILPANIKDAFTAFHNRERKIPEHRFYETHSGARVVALWIAENYLDIEILVYENQYDLKDIEEEELPYKRKTFLNYKELLEFLKEIQYTPEEIYNLVQ